MDISKQAARVAVIGTGTMGRGIVQMLAQSEFVSSVIWIGRSPNGQKAVQSIEDRWQQMVTKERLTNENLAFLLNKINYTNSYSDISDSCCVIEAVAESIDAKREIFKQLAPLQLSAVIASNTSSLSITELASFSHDPSKVVGLHFFNPAPVMQLAEVVVGLSTSATTIDWTLDFARNLGKDPVLVNEAPGFIVNRMLIPMINEAIGIFAEGVASADEIDKAMKLGANHPIGPLALADLIGNDINLSIMETLHIETGDPKYRAHPLLRKMVRANQLGRKTGQGFFKY